MTKKLVSFDDQAEPGQGLPAAVKAELNATYAPESGSGNYVGVQKVDNGGVTPGIIRQPTLTVEKSWPNANVDYRIVWYMDGGKTLYAIGNDYTIRKSTDTGQTWTARGRMTSPIERTAPSGTFLRLASGTLLAASPDNPGTIQFYRSTDDGATWTTVHTGPIGQAPMGSQGWAVDPATGHVYYGEYQSTIDATETLVRVYRSTDDGATWPVFATLPGPASTVPAADRVRHVHSVTHDPVTGRMIVATGDSSGASGLYQTNAAGTGLEPLLLNRQTPIPGGEGARAIGVIPFPDYIVYMGDASSNPYIMRVKRGPNATVLPETTERLYRVNSTGWWAIKASADGSRWVVSASPENPSVRLDSAAHLYSVEDQGDTIIEIGSLAGSAGTTGIMALAPVGTSSLGGEVFMLASSGTARPAQWMLRLTRGNTALAWPSERPRAYAWQTQNSGVMEFPAGETVKVFGGTKAPVKGFRYLRIYDAGVKLVSGAGPATLYIRQGSVFFTAVAATHGMSYRSHLGVDAGSNECASYLIQAEAEVTFELRNNSASSVLGYVTYGWGN